MPYEIKQNYKDCDGFAVVKEDDGDVMGCHDTEGKADDQIKALHASEGDKGKEKDRRKYAGEVAVYIPWDAYSFSAIAEYKKAQERKERVEEIIRYYQVLTDNILYANDEDVPDKSAALNALTAELAVELDKADALKQRRSIKELAADIGAFLGLAEKEEPEPAANPFMVWKDTDTDLFRWLAVWSNKYRDDDNPSEIISSTAHRDFVKAVYAGQAEFPELWHFHVPGTRWGKAEWLHYDEDTGFVLAAGTVDAGHEKEAEALAAFDMPIGVSHGMPIASIVRDKNDPSVITRYRTREISDLPADRAANKLTAFQVLKEASMAIPDEKRSYLRAAGLTDEKIGEVEEGLKATAEEAEAIGLESKQEDEPIEGEQVAAPSTETTEGEPAEETPITREEIAEGIGAAVAPVAEAVGKLAGLVDSALKELSDLSATDEEKIARKAADTPAASIAALVAKNMSAVGSDRTEIGKDETVNGPAETKATKARVGIPWIDDMLSEPTE